MVAQKKVGFAVVGLGSIAQGSVLPAFAHSKKAQLVALVSRDKNKAAQLARAYAAPAWFSQSEFSVCLADARIEAVYIATPQGEHEWVVTAAARAGKHVLCEKPLAATVAQSRRIVGVCKQHNVRLMTAYRKYFEPSTVFLKQLIQKGKLGRIDTIHTAFSELHVAGKSLDWLLDAKLSGGGPLMDLGIYCVNTARWLVDEDPVSVSAELWKHEARFGNVEQGIAFRMNFPSGLRVLGSTSYGASLSSLIYVQGAKGWASISPAFDFNQAREFKGNISGRILSRRFKITDEFAPELDAFAHAIRTDADIAPDGEQGHRDMIILHSIYQSATKSRTVTVQYE